MIVVRLAGGLGNQLFQYAAGRRLARIHKVELRFDVSALTDGTYKTVRNYELGAFDIPQLFASYDEFSKYPSRYPSRALLIRNRFQRFFRSEVFASSGMRIKEKHFHFDPYVLDLPDNVYLDGYWQSERYFSDASDIIRRELVVKYPLSGQNNEFAALISDCHAISIHVRRGDYVTDSRTNQVHGVCGLDYYSDAVEYISSRIDSPVFFVFSDDPLWVRQNLILRHPAHFVEHNDSFHSFEDLRLMSLCRHHVVANSTFSWWGAWLNPRKEKIVVAPGAWFRKHIETKDLIPNGWVRLSGKV